MQNSNSIKRLGSFAVEPGNEISGELTIAGRETSLFLFDKDFFPTHDIPDRCIKGILHDRERVSLLDCVGPPAPASGSQFGEGYEFANIFPHFVFIGDHHIGPSDAVVSEISLIVDDASTIFYDFDAFGLVVDPRPFIQHVANANFEHTKRKVAIGPHPEIFYFSGKTEILSALTNLGKIRVTHNPGHNWPGPAGFSLQNSIQLAVEFKTPVTFSSAFESVRPVVMFLETVVGRPQNVIELNVRTATEQSPRSWLRVYWSMAPTYERKDNNLPPQPYDTLLDPIRHPDEFCSVIASWLERDNDWRDARARFSDSFNKQNSFDIDRIIGSANMFDILPTSAVPADVPIDPALNRAMQSAKTSFRSLPPSPERDSVLNVLGRVGKSNLKQKIRYRHKAITQVIGTEFPDLELMRDEAVNCRNHYVHGSPPRFDYQKHFSPLVTFFARTLEFVFAASDLMDSGWDIRAWTNRSSSLSHPFSAYRYDYGERLALLKSLLPASL